MKKEIIDTVYKTSNEAYVQNLKKQEQDNKMYSEEDLREAFKQSRQCKIFEKDMPPVHNEFEDWFEQFKNKQI